jgi:hypothetical protein
MRIKLKAQSDCSSEKLDCIKAFSTEFVNGFSFKRWHSVGPQTENIMRMLVHLPWSDSSNSRSRPTSSPTLLLGCCKRVPTQRRGHVRGDAGHGRGSRLHDACQRDRLRHRRGRTVEVGKLRRRAGEHNVRTQRVAGHRRRKADRPHDQPLRLRPSHQHGTS